MVIQAKSVPWKSSILDIKKVSFWSANRIKAWPRPTPTRNYAAVLQLEAPSKRYCKFNFWHRNPFCSYKYEGAIFARGPFLPGCSIHPRGKLKKVLRTFFSLPHLDVTQKLSFEEIRNPWFLLNLFYVKPCLFYLYCFYVIIHIHGIFLWAILGASTLASWTFFC